VFILAVIGGFLLWLRRSTQSVGIFLSAFLGYMVLVSCLWPQARFFVPIYPALALLASIVIFRDYGKMKSFHPDASLSPRP
jgi:hypothetical protein